LKQEELDKLKTNYDSYILHATEIESELETALQISEAKLHASIRSNEQKEILLQELNKKLIYTHKEIERIKKSSFDGEYNPIQLKGKRVS
jgi:hypothetical protein